MSKRGASPVPNENKVTLSSPACINQPTNPLINNQFKASGLNLPTTNTACLKNYDKLESMRRWNKLGTFNQTKFSVKLFNIRLWNY